MQPHSTLTDHDEELVKLAILKTLSSEPPTIGVIGVSGTGKSSTINAMFQADLAISHVRACTTQFRDLDMHLDVTKGPASGEGAVLRMVDAPGLGEDVRRDREYLDMYHANLARCDVILWVMTARNRAVALDQFYLEKLKPFHDRMVFGINQIDIVEPMDWSPKTNLPSLEQEANIEAIVLDRKGRLAPILGRQIDVVPYSSKTKYGLQELFTALIGSCPKGRSWIFSVIKNFGPYDLLPAVVRERVVSQVADPLDIEK
jgi:predicted GTPase